MTPINAIPTLAKSTLANAGPTFWMPEQASTVAPDIDFVFSFITWLCYFFFALIVITMIFVPPRFRRAAR